VSAQSRPFAGFAFLFLGSTAAAINYQAPSVIFDAVVRDLQMAPEAATFIQTLYIACLGASLILAGSLGDEIGKKKLCLIGLATVIGGNVVAAMAPAGAVLLAARAIQGIGMAAFLSTMVALCSSLFPDPRQKALAFSLFGASVGVAVTTATLIGELVLAHLGWRALFLTLVPLFLIAFAGIQLLVHEERAYTAPVRFDPLGALLLAVALLSLIFALSEGSKMGWFDSRLIVAMLIAAAAAFVLFNAHQLSRRRRGLYIALDYSLFESPSFASGTLTTFLYFAGALAVQQVWPSLLLKQFTAMTPVGLGLLMAGMGIAFTLTSLAASRIAQAIGVKNAVIAGLAVNAVCLAAIIALVSARGTFDLTLLAVLLLGFGAGYGLVFTKLTYLAVAGIASDRAASASGVLLASRQTSAALGAATLVAILEATSASFVAVSGAACVFIALALVSGLFLREPS
jgi:predicted MFS family arabinose efflux permease